MADLAPKSDVKATKEPDRWRVMTPDGNRVLFDGNEADARDYVEKNFPRVHVTPGQVYGDDGAPPDVHLVGPSGKESLNAGEWTEVKGK
jgi:hypothetical protein